MTSVALCTYNGERYIREQLQSIFNQSMPVDEVVIGDDGSSDATMAILQGEIPHTGIGRWPQDGRNQELPAHNLRVSR